MRYCFHEKGEGQSNSGIQLCAVHYGFFSDFHGEAVRCQGKTYFNYPNKYYYTDVGLRNARLNYRQYDPGHIMENIIYNELLQRGYSVDVGVVYDRTGGGKTQKEIDFVSK